MSDRQFMVRIMRDHDEEYADVVVDASDEKEALDKALKIVESDPYSWFRDLPKPSFYLDPSSEVEELDRSEYESAKL